MKDNWNTYSLLSLRLILPRVLFILIYWNPPIVSTPHSQTQINKTSRNPLYTPSVYTHAARHSQSRAEALDSNDYSFKDQSVRRHKGWKWLGNSPLLNRPSILVFRTYTSFFLFYPIRDELLWPKRIFTMNGNNRWNRVSLSRSRMDHHFRGQLFALIWVTTVDILKLNGRYFEHRLRKLEEGKISKRFIIRYAVYFNSFRSFDRSLFRNFERHSSRQTWNKLMMHSDIPRSSHKSFLANKMERWLITRFSDVPIESSFLL